MGADDGYICQFSRATEGFWGARNALELGASFKAAPGARPGAAPRRIMPQVGGRGGCRPDALLALCVCQPLA
jgi:hypothetical protein